MQVEMPRSKKRRLTEEDKRMEEAIKGAIECSSTLRQRLTGARVGPAHARWKGNQADRCRSEGEQMIRNKSSQRRSRYETVADILRIAKRGARRTRIVYGANLNFKILQDYMERLEKAGLVTSSNGRVETTEKGREYLREFHGIRDFGVT